MSTQSVNATGWSVHDIARHAACQIPDGAYVNLGIGLPELIANYVPEDREVIFHTENGLLGMGPSPQPDQADPELINAGKKPVSAASGASYFHQADSFAMIRGGHIDLCVLGAMQVSADGDLANWSTGPDDAMPAVGGAMDLVAGTREVWVVTRHCTKHGESKLVASCTLPITGLGVVRKIFTDLATMDVRGGRFIVKALAPGIGINLVRARTGAPLEDRQLHPH